MVEYFDNVALVNEKNASNRNEPDWKEVIRQQVDSLRFGVVQIVVHEGRVVQIERTEKVRLGAKSSQNHFPADQITGSQPT